MPLKPGSSRKVISENISELTHHGSRKRPHDQIVAIALHNAYDKKADGGGIADAPKLAAGGVGGLAASPFAGDQAPSVMVNQPQGIASALPQSQGIPIGLQLAAIKAMTKADQQVRQGTQNSGNADSTTDQQYLRMMNGQQAQTPAMSKGGVFGVLNAKPPRSLGRVTEPVVQGGFLHSIMPGRTDGLATQVRSGSHIIPADVVSSLGQGNSLAGARHLDMTMRALPSAFARGGSVRKMDDGGSVDGPPDYTNQYNTPLNPSQTAQYNKWKQSLPAAQQNTYDYDLQGAWLAGSGRAGNGHFPDTFKKPNHPTFSSESQYNGVNGAKGGQWVPQGKTWAYVPSQTNLQMYGTQGLTSYFNKQEPGSTLRLPSQAEGGRTLSPRNPSPPPSGQDHEPVLLAGGEYVVPPEEVKALGGGDHKKGHDMLDKMIVRVRKKSAKQMLKLPGPKK